VSECVCACVLLLRSSSSGSSRGCAKENARVCVRECACVVIKYALK